MAEPLPQHPDLGGHAQFSRHTGPSCLGPFWPVGASALSCCVNINSFSGPFLHAPSQGSSPDLPPPPTSCWLFWAMTVVHLSVLRILGTGKGSVFSLEPGDQHRGGHCWKLFVEQTHARVQPRARSRDLWSAAPRVPPGTGGEWWGRHGHRVSGLAPCCVHRGRTGRGELRRSRRGRFLSPSALSLNSPGEALGAIGRGLLR